MLASRYHVMQRHNIILYHILAWIYFSVDTDSGLGCSRSLWRLLDEHRAYSFTCAPRAGLEVSWSKDNLNVGNEIWIDMMKAMGLLPWLRDTTCHSFLPWNGCVATLFVCLALFGLVWDIPGCWPHQEGRSRGNRTRKGRPGIDWKATAIDFEVYPEIIWNDNK